MSNTQYRLGNFSASSVATLMGKPKGSGEWTKTALTYIYDKAAEVLTGIQPEVTSYELQHGIETEPIARAFYEELFSVSLPEVDGLVKNNLSGCADGVLSDKVVEFKCPVNNRIHLENLLLDLDTFKKSRKEYYYQVQSYMYLYDRDLAHFVSYSDIFVGANKMSILEVPRDEDTVKQILERVALAEKEKNKILAKLK